MWVKSLPVIRSGITHTSKRRAELPGGRQGARCATCDPRKPLAKQSIGQATVRKRQPRSPDAGGDRVGRCISQDDNLLQPVKSVRFA